MELIVHEDPEGPPGYGWIEFDRAGESEEVAVSRPSNDRPWLGPEGAWQSVRHLFRLTGGITPSRRRGLKLIPEIVDAVPGDVEVSIEVPARGVTLSGWWPHLSSSGRATTPGVVIVGGAVARPAKAVPPPEEPAPKAEPPVLKAEARPAPPPRKRSSFLRWLLALLLLLALALAGAWYFKLLPQWLLDLFATEQTCEDCDVTKLTVAQLQERLMQMIARGASAQELYDFGKPLYELADTERREIGYRAIDAAAQRGHPDALFELGRIFDPRDTVPGQRVGVEKPDPELAARYYKAAATANATGAREALDGLCAELRRAQPAADSPEGRALSESCGS